ncbi:PTS transporter subunit EIIC [uncultured Clostridium sp.]|jgi:PTS system N-acetylglucosamine-specific IIC component|uniref:PTS transporter subunit EIIC n=1 Tax=uncultured Clostridium sp. TaxID=59620 RepID=UPI002602B4A9|nr:PTS transporter subunit EIIC [uncultured Clostridium sp.]
MEKQENTLMKRLGKAFILPIALLPIAILLSFIGNVDFITSLGLPEQLGLIGAGGQVIIDSIPLIIAMTLAIGISDDGNGAAGLSGAIGYLVLSNGSKFIWSINYTEEIAAQLNVGIVGGIIAGAIAGFCYNKFKSVKLPEFLGFFAGRRLVPIMTSLVLVFVALGFGFGWKSVQIGLIDFGTGLAILIPSLV